MLSFIGLNLLCLVFALLLDQMLGDPRTALHPVCLLGRMNRWLESMLFWAGFSGGVALTLISSVLATGATALLLVLAWQVHLFLYLLLNILLLSFSLSARSMVEHAQSIAKPLEAGDVEAARSALAMIVSRDTAKLDESGVARSAVESVGENFPDGVLAPALYGIFGTAAGAMLFKSISTLDSMVGYRNDRYEKFGKFAARADDVLGFIPARLTLLLVPLAAVFSRLRPLSAWRMGWRYRRAHASPNAAHSMACFAGALDLQLGGPTTYFGSLQSKPFIGEGSRQAEAASIHAATRLFNAATVLLGLLAFLAYWLLRYLDGCPLCV
ncbi:adenosylcobinamide-phosphate synthase CbiB [Desulfurispira natronophila]|uniref:Cobalamin biosynthesis protein CobD n=1 Tax=Desulfurispira natronophila TaxID=682562 RepID=A0A7W8DHK2_9BACT|nr:adenosylcobinamide-phosphate synthase CbiB [Desulfurispira natronophila]MBB5022529.1 adenosylcobinamide-phosphate synthase [Desulfurispira natronophila]